jgi:outer membrane protein assembly factor BamA
MIRGTISLIIILALTPGSLIAAEAVAEVRFHGNYSIPDDEMARLSGVAVGLELSEGVLADIRQRLLRTKRFDWVEITRRYRSLTSQDEVVLVVTVREKPPASKKIMFMPILTGSDEYGLTYGGRVTALDLLGAGERISFPLTWGGERRAAIESRFGLRTPIVDSFTAETAIYRRENPHFEIGDLRREVWGGVSRRFRNLEISWHTGWTGVEFGATSESFVSYGAGIAFDTRQDENLPRDAIYAGAGWEKMSLRGGGPDFNRYKLDLRGYKGLFGQAILAAQVFYHRSDGRLPDYQRPFLGGASTVRGYKPGEFIGDNLFLTSIELRMPMTSPLKIYHAGIDFFFDAGAVYEDGRKLADTNFKHGAGLGVFFLIAGFGIKVDVAHNLHDSARVHFSTGFRF